MCSATLSVQWCSGAVRCGTTRRNASSYARTRRTRTRKRYNTVYVVSWGMRTVFKGHSTCHKQSSGRTMAPVKRGKQIKSKENVWGRWVFILWHASLYRHSCTYCLFFYFSDTLFYNLQSACSRKHFIDTKNCFSL